MSAFKIIYLFVLFIIVESKVKISDLVEICSLSDPKINECIASSTLKFVPNVVKGIREWKVQPLDPIFIPRIAIAQNGGPVTFDWEHLNCTIRGLGNFKLQKFTFDKDKDNYFFKYSTTSDNFSLTGHFKGQGKVFGLPVGGEGEEDIHAGYTATDMIIKCKEKRSPSGKNYLKIEKIDIKLRFGKVTTKTTNLFDEKTEFGRTMKKFVQEHSQEITNEMLPALQDAVEQLMTQYVQKILDHVPLDEMFKP